MKTVKELRQASLDYAENEWKGNEIRFVERAYAQKDFRAGAEWMREDIKQTAIDILEWVAHTEWESKVIQDVVVWSHPKTITSYGSSHIFNEFEKFKAEAGQKNNAVK